MVENNMRRNRNEKQKPQRRKNQRRAIDIGDILIETPFWGTTTESRMSVGRITSVLPTTRP
jgi:hypothetical protein